MNKIKVLVVDDSPLICKLMSKIINSQCDMETVAIAPDPYVARDQIRKFNPDVLTLDIDMPKMDGIEFLEHLMRLRPIPVLMLSTLSQQDLEITFQALEVGAVDFVTKPKLDIGQGMIHCANQITDKIRAAHAARFRLRHVATARVLPEANLLAQLPKRKSTPLAAVSSATQPVLVHRHPGRQKLVMIGSSTGGTEAIRIILEQLPKEVPAILITQHMPAGFTRSFAARLNQVCKISVKEAVHGEPVLAGHAYISPGDRHLMLACKGGEYICQLSDGEPVNRHRPSVEVLFKSGQQASPQNIVGIMLTGMGKDGAQAMADMKKTGAYNICQDEASSVVYGMPREAIALGAANAVLPLHSIAAHLLDYLSKEGNGGSIARA